jgi:hypothetical protein
MARNEVVAEQPPAAAPEVVRWEEYLRTTIVADPALGETEKEALVLARRGQGLFRTRVQSVETRCRVTRVERHEHLRASHIKPWRVCTNEERLEGENGLLLTPSIDHLFDGGFISFEQGGLSGFLCKCPPGHAGSLPSNMMAN